MHVDQLAVRLYPRGHIDFADTPDKGLVGDEADPLRQQNSIVA